MKAKHSSNKRYDKTPESYGKAAIKVNSASSEPCYNFYSHPLQAVQLLRP